MSDKELQDLKDLLDKGIISQEAYDEAVSKLEAKNAKSEVDQLKRELEQLKKRKEQLIENKNQDEIVEPDSQPPTTEKKEAVSKNTLKDFLVSNKIVIGLLIVSVAVFNTQTSNTEDSTVISESETLEGIEVESTVPETNYIVQNLQDVSKAVVRISALGAVADTDNEEVGTGSGFFISNDGYIVTNNHVVAGAQGIEVSTFESDIKIPAQIVGRSECKDLAIIKIEGNDYKYLDWYKDDIVPGLEVYAAGYPLSTEEYTLLDGIVSKKRADGENNWASVDEVVEHTANILPGNSGGPLVTKDGKVVAVNYSVIIEYGQSFAIASNLAENVTNLLLSGEDFLSIGINPEAFIYEEDEIYGIFITAVEPNSIASNAGIIAGDILVELGGNEVGIDGLMTSYCNQLEAWDFLTPLPFTVFRLGTEEILEGELLGSAVESLNVPPIIDLEVCPTSLRIGETYEFNILFIEGTSEATSISVIFTDSTGNFEVDIDPQEYIEPIDINGQTVYAGKVVKPKYFEGTNNKGVVRGSIIDRSGLSSNFECEIDLIIPVTTTTTTVPKTNSTVAAAGTTATTQQTTTTTVSNDTSRPYRSTSRLDIDNVTTTSLTLSWDAFQDNVGVTEYQIYRSNAYIGSTSSTNYNVTGLTPGSYNSFSVYAYDAAGNQSSSYVNNWTYTVSTTTTTIFEDNYGPSRSSSRLTVSNLTQTSLTLSWDAFTDNVGVVEYRVSNPYSPYTLYATTSNTSVDLTGLDTNSFYRFKVVAYDAAGNSSSSYVTTTTTTLNTTTTTSTTTTTIYNAPVFNSISYLGNSSVDEQGLLDFNINFTSYNNKIIKLDVSIECTNEGRFVRHVESVNYSNNSNHSANVLFNLPSGGVGETCEVEFVILTEELSPGYNSNSIFTSGNGIGSNIFTISDITNPSLQSGQLSISSNTTSQLYVYWNAATDNVGIKHYEMYLNDTLVTTTSGTSYEYSGLSQGTTYQVKYCAVDTSDNKSCSLSKDFYTRTTYTLPSLTNLTVTSPYNRNFNNIPGGTGDPINYSYTFLANDGNLTRVCVTAISSNWPVDLGGGANYYDIYDGVCNDGSSLSGNVSIDGVRPGYSNSFKGEARTQQVSYEVGIPNITIIYVGDRDKNAYYPSNKVLCIYNPNIGNPFSSGGYQQYSYVCPGTPATNQSNPTSNVTNPVFNSSVISYFEPND